VNAVRGKIEWLLGQIWFRAIFAALLVTLHVTDARFMAADRFDAPFNKAPGEEPFFKDAWVDKHAKNAKRLAVSRWDAEHYIGLALRGYDACPNGPMTDAEIKRRDAGGCTLTFYPGYPMIGRWVARHLHEPIDYALWYITLVASFFTFFLWTSRLMTARMGITAAWFSLIAFNVYGASCYMVFIGTEACAVAFTFLSFVAYLKKWRIPAAFFAGAASAIRISGVAASMALCFALLVEVIQRPPRKAIEWAERVVCVPISVWGAVVVMRFFKERFGDAFIYARAHELIYSHEAKLEHILHPKPEWIMHGLDNPMHDGMWVVGLVLWFLLGWKALAKHFPSPERAYMIVLVVATLGISVYGSIDLFSLGLSRYALVAFPLFLAIGAFLRQRPVVLILWLSLCRWHYTEADLCYYEGDLGAYGLQKCNLTQWITY
jgi:hypothetical protein